MVKIRLRRMGAKKAPFYRVVVADSRFARNLLLNKINLAIKHVEIFRALTVVTRHLFIAAAIKAHVIAKRNMHVKAQGLIGLTICQCLFIVSHTEIFIEAVRLSTCVALAVAECLN